ncbi:amidohydrolase family protein [Hyphomonas neptunium ATCC 15444]|uniref:Amidohydrolase family protein n=2 Tax=Hyphomonas TaxID=85 RepID=Q0BZS0_HYPNA|nr:amidohydrolase family protein [Hyphomonas neptunium ATCC 15444]
MAAALVLGLSSCATPAQEADTIPEVAVAYTAGITGKRDMPLGKPGQTLPMQAARNISFETDEGSLLSLDVSPAGDVLVFDMLGDIYTLPVSGGKAARLTSGMAMDSQPVWSPDGKAVLFVSDRSGAENLWLMDADGGNPRQISLYDDNPVFVSPEWAPDGKSILVTRYWADRNAYELWRFRPVAGDMGEVLRATQGGDGSAVSTSSLGARYSADGGAIYLASLKEGDPAFNALAAWGIVRIDPVTGEEAAVLPAGAAGESVVPRFRPAVSPDGQSLVFGERREGVTLLKVMHLESGAVRTLGEVDPDAVLASLTHDAIARYDFSADGKALYVNRQGRIDRIALDGGAAEPVPFTADVSQDLGPLGRHPARIEGGAVRARLIQSPELSPDGAALVFTALGRLYVQALEGGAPRLVRGEGETGYHPSWSADGAALAFVSWTKAAGGDVWIAPQADGPARKISAETAFYTHPVFTPDGSAIVVVRSPAETRRRTYMEYGQWREAELVVMPLDGAPSRVLAAGRMGGTPHFAADPGEVLINTGKGVEAVSLADGARRVVTQAVGPGWYFSEGPAAADDLRVSPDGQWALAQIAHQLHLYRLGSAGETFDLSNPSGAHVQLTDIGADYFGWSEDGQEIYWALGAALKRVRLDEVVFERGSAETASRRTDIEVTAQRDEPLGRVLLTGANVIAMTDRASPEAVLANSDILIENGRIARIAPSGEILAGSGVSVVDVSGAYIIPGLIDAHYHVADIRRDVLDFDVWGLKTNLAFGITTLFDPSSLSIDMLTYQDLIEAGDVVGPRLYTTGPAIFDFNDFRSKGEVVSVLRRYSDYYRLSNLKQYRTGNRRVRQWVAEAANELGLSATTEGALSYRFSLTGILDGFSGVEHATPPIGPHKDFVDLSARSGTSGTLTLMITHGGLPADRVFMARDDAFNNQKYADFVPEWFREMRFQNVPAAPLCDYTYGVVGAGALSVHQAGGVVGLGAHGDIPGLGTQWELQAYVESGWTPGEALWAATMGSAQTISRDHALGSLETGKFADLVILNTNPLADIKNTLDIRYVMKNGRLYQPGTLTEAQATVNH